MKRLAVLLFVLLLISSGMAPASASRVPDSGLPGIAYLNMPQNEFGGPTSTAKLRIQSFDIRDAQFELEGEVGYSGGSYPIHLKGAFYQSELGSPGDKVASATDLTDQFTVLHMALRRNQPSETLLVNPVVQGPVFSIYLLRNGTREAIFVEATPEQIANNDLLKVLNGAHTKGHFASDHWAQKLFGATEAGELPKILFVEDYDIRTYSETYQQTPSCSLTYNIQFEARSNGPSDIAKSAADFNHHIKVLRKWTDSNCPLYVEEDSPFVLGTYADPVNVLLRASGDGSTYGDVFLKGHWDGTFNKKVTAVSVYVNLGVAYKIVSINAAVTLGPNQGINQSTTMLYPQGDPANWTKRVKVTYKDRYLPNKDQFFLAVTQVAWGVGSYGQKSTDANWTVPIYADWDDLSTTLYYRTTSYPWTLLYYYSG